jgi:hypothetical protein
MFPRYNFISPFCQLDIKRIVSRVGVVVDEDKFTNLDYADCAAILACR